jgi:hypothetical protein
MTAALEKFNASYASGGKLAAGSAAQVMFARQREVDRTRAFDLIKKVRH